jgi:hypothetical protein
LVDLLQTKIRNLIFKKYYGSKKESKEGCKEGRKKGKEASIVLPGLLEKLPTKVGSFFVL